MKNGHISLSIAESDARQIETDFSKAQSGRLAVLLRNEREMIKKYPKI